MSPTTINAYIRKFYSAVLNHPSRASFGAVLKSDAIAGVKNDRLIPNLDEGTTIKNNRVLSSSTVAYSTSASVAPDLSAVLGGHLLGREGVIQEEIPSPSVENLSDRQEGPLKMPLKSAAQESTIRPFSDIPGPKGFPVIGTLLDYVKKNGYGFKKIFQAQYDRSVKYGTIYKEKIGPEVMVVVTDPKEYSKVVRTDSKYPNRMPLDPMIHYRKIRNLPIGLFNATGEDWYKYRRILNPKMLDMKEANNYLPRLNEVSLDFITMLRTVAPNGNFCMERELFKWAMESIGVLLFDSRLNCFQIPMPAKTQAFIESVAGYTRTLQSLITDFPWYKYVDTKLWKENVAYADVIFQTGEELVNEKKREYGSQEEKGINSHIPKQDNRYSILKYLLETTPWSNKEINVTLIDLMMAAIETTCFAVLWTMYCLAKNPRAQFKLHEEINTIKSHNSNFVQFDMEKLYQITYLKNCVKEALRIYPVVYTTSRIVDKELSINEYEIPQKTHVQGSLYAMGRTAALFDHPDQYVPERWSRQNIVKDEVDCENAASKNSIESHFNISWDSSANEIGGKCPFHNTDQQNDLGNLKIKKMTKQVSNFASLPWGHGSRMCIGRRISEVEIYTLLWSLVQNYEISIREDAPQEVDPVLHLVLCPASKIKLKLTPREDSLSKVKSVN